jgi:hypothetical protein
MRIVSANDVRDWYVHARNLAELTQPLGYSVTRHDDPLHGIDLPVHPEYLLKAIVAEGAGPIELGRFDLIPFYCLCRGAFSARLGADRRESRSTFRHPIPAGRGKHRRARQAIPRP